MIPSVDRRKQLPVYIVTADFYSFTPPFSHKRYSDSNLLCFMVRLFILLKVTQLERPAQNEGDAMGKNKVVARFKNGSILKGNTSDFLPNKNQFHLETEGGDIQTVEVDQLKAIFFVRDFTGNKDHVESYEDNISGAGRKISVKFFDGEMIIGYTTGYSPERQGFYITPAETKSNNERIFVVKSASEKIDFL
jgi:hypothetical protein